MLATAVLLLTQDPQEHQSGNSLMGTCHGHATILPSDTVLYLPTTKYVCTPNACTCTCMYIHRQQRHSATISMSDSWCGLENHD